MKSTTVYTVVRFYALLNAYKATGYKVRGTSLNSDGERTCTLVRGDRTRIVALA